MPKSKSELKTVTEKVLKYWYIDLRTHRIKKLKSHSKKNKFIGYNQETSQIISKNGKSIPVYSSFKEANIMLYNIKIEKLRKKWKLYIDKTIKINDEIGKLLEALDNLRNESEWI